MTQPHKLDVVWRARRGMLLLLVLLMLALFLGAGAVLLTISLRARAAARANARASAEASLSETTPREALDDALMALLRGAASGTTGSVTIGGTGSPPVPLENLLADKYGQPLTGTGSVLAGGNLPVMSLALSGLRSGTTVLSATTSLADLNGRILTVRPRAGAAGEISSFRVLGASGTGASGTCHVARMPALVEKTLPANPFEVVINGREFTRISGTVGPEPYDAPDTANVWLARPAIASNQITGTFHRLSYWPTGSNAFANGADNDNDGIPDGVWIPGPFVTGTVIPNQISPFGGIVRFEVSYLVVDLDGRVNVNAAGMANREMASYAGTPDGPLGMGYGPADVDPSLLFSGTSRQPMLPSSSGTSEFTGAGVSAPPGVWPTLLLSGTPALPSLMPSQPNADLWRQSPIIGNLFGRYGANGAPGVAGDDTGPFQLTGTTHYPSLVAGTNAFADLKGRAKIAMAGPAVGEIVARMQFHVPTWSGTSNDSSDDPYESRLDAHAPRWGTARRPAPQPGGNDDSPFTLSELEVILRAFDPDVRQLPQRLAAGLENAAQRARTMVTTDSWDSPALTGGAAQQLFTFLSQPNLQPSYSGSAAWMSGTGSNVVSPDVAAGLRFNLNRPLQSGTVSAGRADRQRYCKDLYCLIRALSGTATSGSTAVVTADAAAQWVANVVDFRDGDPVMTGFEYDRELFNNPVVSGTAWQVDGDLQTVETGTNRAIVWGGERPEIVITETAIAADVTSGTNIYVNLHRLPWNASAIGSSGSTTRFEQTAVELASGTAPLDLSKQVTGTAGASAIWQLRFRNNSVVRWNALTSSTSESQFVASGTGSVQEVLTTIVGGSTAAPLLTVGGSGAYLCVCSTTATTAVAVTVPSFPITSGSFSLAETGTIVLERLADPTRANAVDNPYVAVDAARMPPVPSSPPGVSSLRRKGPADSDQDDHRGTFWGGSHNGNWIAGTDAMSAYAASGSSGVPWFHWPNRPFVSQAELMLVPSGTVGNVTGTRHILANHQFPPQSLLTGTGQIVFGIDSGTTGVASGTATLGSLLLEATRVPSLFAATMIPITGTSASMLGLDLMGTPCMLSTWREPGRVNVNTILSGTQPGTTDDIVWCALVGGTTPANPFRLTGSSGTAAVSLGQLLSLNQPTIALTATSGTGARGSNPFLSASVPIRLGTTATVRSNVFAVWITVRISDSSPNAPPPIIKRLFAIIDRSIPAGYAPGQDLNVRDCIRIKRYLD